MKKSRLISLIAGALLVLQAPAAFAAQTFYIKGYSYNRIITGIGDTGRETMTLAASATYNPTTGRGIENIRVFSRTYNAGPNPVGVNLVRARFGATPGKNANSLVLSVDNSTPSPMASGQCASDIIGSLVGDMAGAITLTSQPVV